VPPPNLLGRQENKCPQQFITSTIEMELIQ